MKTQVTLTVDSDIKEEFKKIANNMWANMSTLVNMYFTQVVNTWKIDFFYNDKKQYSNDINNCEVENFTKEEMKEIEELPNFKSFMKTVSWI